jgi:hypothetical protein
MPTISDVAFYNGVPVNGATINAYKLSRFLGAVPALNTIPPGASDAGPTTSGTTEGGVGAFEIFVPTIEPYYVASTYNNVIAWERYDVQSPVGTNRITVTVNGALNLDASLGHFQAVLLEANVTSSTIVNASDGQIMFIEWTQDATGSRTYSWPANCHFAGGAAGAASTTASFRDIYQFRYNANTVAWYETSRSLAVV